MKGGCFQFYDVENCVVNVAHKCYNIQYVVRFRDEKDNIYEYSGK